MDVGGCCFYSHQFDINGRCSEVIQLLACKIRLTIMLLHLLVFVIWIREAFNTDVH